MPSQNAGGSPTAQPEQLFEFHNTVVRYNKQFLILSIFEVQKFRIIFLAFRAETAKSINHALRNFARLYR